MEIETSLQEKMQHIQIRKKLTSLLLTCGLLVLAFSCEAQETLHGTVKRIVDGDTIIFELANGEKERIRLADIDAPETDQPWGRQASAALRELSQFKFGRVEVVDTDRYGRMVGTLWIDNDNINRILVQEGHAWVYRNYLRDNSLLKLEASAQSFKSGLWQWPEAISPSDWRKGGREIASTQPTSAKVFVHTKKSRSGICHRIGSTYYDRTLHFTSFDNLQSCLDSGGRLPKK